MIFHYAGKYDGDESKLPQKEHHPHAVQFKELEDTKKLSLIANIGCVLTMALLAIPFLVAFIHCHTGFSYTELLCLVLLVSLCPQ